MNLKYIESTAAYSAYYDPIMKRCKDLKRYLTGDEKRKIIKLFEYLNERAVREEPIDYKVIYKQLELTGWRKEEFIQRKDENLSKLEKQKAEGVPVKAEAPGKVYQINGDGTISVVDEEWEELNAQSMKMKGIDDARGEFRDKVNKHIRYYTVIRGLVAVDQGQEVKKGDVLGLASKK